MEPNRNARRKRESKHAEQAQARENHHKTAPALSRSAHAAKHPTVRKVNPETSIPEEIINQLDELSLGNPPIVSSRNTKHEHRKSLTHGYTMSDMKDADFDLKGIKDTSPTSLRPRTRTLEERRREKSPANSHTRARNRIGSLHSTGTPAREVRREPIASIGHPSTVSSTQPVSLERHLKSASSSRGRVASLTKCHEPPLPQTAPQQNQLTKKYYHYYDPPTGSSNGKKILHLMRSGCGQMDGLLALRKSEHHSWTLSHCKIDGNKGSLLCEVTSDKAIYKTLVPDLRGCKVKVAFDVESFLPFLEIVSRSSLCDIHLQPQTQEQLDSWFAALLCWQPISPKGIKTRISKPLSPTLGDRKYIDSRRHSEISLLKEAPIIKVGKMIHWDTSVTFGITDTTHASRSPLLKTHSFDTKRWRKVSCTLRENGELKLYSITDVNLISVVRLSQLSRHAVQRLDPSILRNDFCIAIYPCYRIPAEVNASEQPIYLSLDSRVSFEVWLVLLKMLTVPHFYGPVPPFQRSKESSPKNIRQSFSFKEPEFFRMERRLSVRITEARLSSPASPKLSDHEYQEHSRSATNISSLPEYFIEILLDREIRAKTPTRGHGTSILWFEEFKFQDLPDGLSTISFMLKKRPPNASHKEQSPWTRDERSQKQNSLSSYDVTAGYAEVSIDILLGQLDIYVDDLNPEKDAERWWPITNLYGQKVGEMMVKIGVEENVLFMTKDYRPLAEFLSNISADTTLEIAQTVPNKLRNFAECLLNIYQVSGQAGQWIMALAEKEIDGDDKGAFPSRPRNSKRTVTSEFGETLTEHNDRELFLRDLGKSAALEANLLFRGNTLLTRALDMHMKRVGKEYLEETLMDSLRHINNANMDCEVDPNKIVNISDLEKHWQCLLLAIDQIWQSIAGSAFRCPAELRLIFRHIRACTEDKYGNFLRTVSYSSVSSFLFLRFFCPAILNPQLFGLIKDQPNCNARRTFTLIAKSLQGLANMTTTGSKEPWMEHANQFLSSNRRAFKDFIDNVCSIPSDRTPPLPSSYSTPLTIMQRLPSNCRDGLPSLPYLIDQSWNYATLVTLWLRSVQEHATAFESFCTSNNVDNKDDSGHSQDTDLKKNGSSWKEHLRSTSGESKYNCFSIASVRRFHQICCALERQAKDYLDQAEQADRPRSVYDDQWEHIIEQLEQSAPLDGVAPASSVPPESRVITGPVNVSSTSYTHVKSRSQTQSRSHAQIQALNPSPNQAPAQSSENQAQSPIELTVSTEQISCPNPLDDGTIYDSCEDSGIALSGSTATLSRATGFRSSVSGRSSRKGSIRHGSVTSMTEDITTALPPFDEKNFYQGGGRDRGGDVEVRKNKDREREKTDTSSTNGKFKGFSMPGFGKKKWPD